MIVTILSVILVARSENGRKQVFCLSSTNEMILTNLGLSSLPLINLCTDFTINIYAMSAY